MRFLLIVDGLVLGLCTRVAHAFQKLTGRTNFFIAKIGLGIASVGVILRIINYFQPFLRHPTSLVELFLLIMGPIAFAKSMAVLDQFDQNAATSAEKTAIIEPMEEWLLKRRLFFLFLAGVTSLLFWYDFTFTILSYGIGTFVYFISVDPLPPSKSKIRGWMERLSSTVTAQTPAKSES